MVCKQYGIPYCTHSLNAPCQYIQYWPEDGSLEPKHVAKLCIIDYILMMCLFWVNHFMNKVPLIIDRSERNLQGLQGITSECEVSIFEKIPQI